MDDDQQFCLRWNNHQSTLISVFDTLLENGTLVDCTLAAEGKFLKAHKVVLSACSPYFAALLSQQYDKHPIFILKDVKFQELRAMMDYMYRGEVNISQDQLAALLKAAESLQIKGLSDSRGGGGGNNNSTNTPSQAHKSDVKQHIPVPPKASGLTIENKRPLLRTDFDAEVSGSREGSVSPSTRKRKKVNQRRKSLAETNNLLDNHDQHSNSSSHSNNQQQQLSTSATSAPTNNLSVTNNKKTEQDGNNQEHDEDNAHNTKRLKQTTDDSDNNKQDTELMIEPKNEYDDDDEDDENVEDLTMDDDMMEDLDQAGPSHGGEGSSQGYHWQMDGRNQESQEGSGQHRDAQGDGACDTNTTINLDKYFYFPENNSEYSQHNFKIALPTLPEAKTPQQQQQESWIDYTSVHSSVSTGNNGIDDDIELPPLTEIKQEKFDEDYEVRDIPVWHTAKSTAKITMYPTKENTKTPVRRKFKQIQPKPPVVTQHIMQLPPLTQIHKTKPKLIAVAVKKIIPIQPKPTNLPQLTQIQSPTKTINLQTLSTSPDSKLIIKKISQNVVNTRRHSTGNSSKIVPTKELLESLKQENIIYQDNEDKPWYCKTCGRNYKWRNSLKQHIKNECGVPPKYHCVRNCGYKTHIHSNLKRHLNSKFCKPSSPAELQTSDECLLGVQGNDENI